MLLLSPSKVRIAVDVDGVLLNSAKKWIEVYNKKNNTNHTIDFINCWDFHETIGMSKKEFFKILEKAMKEILYIEPCFEMAHYYMFLLRDEHVDIVTGSLANRDLLIQRLEQLHIRQGIEYNELIQLPPDDKFAKLNLKYDIYIDDNPKLAQEIDFHGGKMFQVLVNQPWNRDYKPKRNVMRAYNWEDTMEAIQLFKNVIEASMTLQ